MNPTDTDRERDASAEKFFRDVLVPLAQFYQTQGMQFFAMQPDPALTSYFQDCVHKQMNPKGFELPAARSLDDFVKALADEWNLEGYPELAQIAAQLLILARQLAHEEKQEDDLPPFTYTMF